MAKEELKTCRDLRIKNMSQKELIIFLYKSALELMDQGKERILASDVPGTKEKLNRARNIFLHLLATLNLEKGGEFAKKLSAFYSYFVEKIIMANACNNVDGLDEIIPLVNEIKEAWEKMDNNDPGESSPGINSNPDSQLISMEV